MNIVLFTTCTNRKKVRPSENLCAETLPRGIQNEIYSEWATRLSNCNDTIKADLLYCGRGFSEIKKLSQSLGTYFYIISSGLGLIKSNTYIPSYNITISKNARNNLLSKIKNYNFSYSDWWNSVNTHRNGENPISNLVNKSTNCIFIFGLSSAYWQLIENDMTNIEPNKLRWVRLSGVNKSTLPSWAHECVLPYNDNFDGKDSPLPGTKSDFQQRTCVHYVKNVLANTPPPNDIKHIELLMRKMTPPKSIARNRLQDFEIISIMADRLSKNYLSGAMMLRWLRDEKKIACEQTRCKLLYKKALEISQNG